MKKPFISIIMPVYNAEHFVSQAVESILRQTYSDFEFIIIDDGSTDSTPRILAQYNDTRIRFIRKNYNEGIINVLNLGIQFAKGRYIARMDADDISLPKRLEKQVAFLEQRKDIAILGTRAIRIDERGRFLEYMVSVTSPQHIQKLLEAGFVPIVHPSVMMRADFIRKLGGYRDGFLHVEDKDLWLRAIENGAKIANLKDTLLLYRTYIKSVTIQYIVERCHSGLYAMDCFYRRKQGLPERSKEEFLASIDLKRYEAGSFWQAAFLMLMVQEVEKAKVLLDEALNRSHLSKGVRILKKLLSTSYASRVALLYRKYRNLRGFVSSLPIAPYIVMLKNFVFMK